MKTEFREMPTWWNIPKAIEHASLLGLQTKQEGGKNLLESKYYPSQVDIEGDPETVFNCYLLYMHHWNGFEIPFFEKEAALKVAELVNRDREGLTTMFIEEGGIFYQFAESDDERGEVEPITITCEGKEVTVYDFGFLGWIWSKTVEEEGEETGEE